MNFSRFYGKNINPSCKICLYYIDSGEQNGKMICEKGKNPESGKPCGAFRYEPTLRKPKTQPLLAEFSPEDFKI